MHDSTNKNGSKRIVELNLFPLRHQAFEQITVGAISYSAQHEPPTSGSVCRDHHKSDNLSTRKKNLFLLTFHLDVLTKHYLSFFDHQKKLFTLACQTAETLLWLSRFASHCSTPLT